MTTTQEAINLDDLPEPPCSPVKVLDQGYVQHIEHWGSDERIIEAARMSTAKGFLGWGPKFDGSPGDEKLLRFLWENNHATPFEMAGLTIEVQCPIFVIREWHRHRVPFGYNELSARYTPMPDLNYVPTLERCMLGSDGKNKQAGTIKDAGVLTEEAARVWLQQLEHFYEKAEQLYQQGLHIGLPKELARIVVPVGRYTRMRATGNLRGWLGFLGLRMATNAQWEIRMFANVVGSIICERFPRTWELFSEGRK
jgi:thymidylate synthase (FAD)